MTRGRNTNKRARPESTRILFILDDGRRRRAADVAKELDGSTDNVQGRLQFLRRKKLVDRDIVIGRSRSGREAWWFITKAGRKLLSGDDDAAAPRRKKPSPSGRPVMACAPFNVAEVRFFLRRPRAQI